MSGLPVLGPSRAVYNGDIGDPFVLPVSAGKGVTTFVAFGTGDWPARVPTARSADLSSWEAGPDALPVLPAWAAPDPGHSLSWAPAVLHATSGYLLYISLPEAHSGQQCIGVARSRTPEGPYSDGGTVPLLCQHDLGGSIDPTVVRDRDGRLHVLWKNDGNAVGAASSLWEQRLRADGLGLAGPVHRLLTAGPAWQGGIVEEPSAMPAAGGGWWLFYSGNFFDRPEYATGVAFCPRIDGPCRETAEAPFLDTAGLHQDGQFAPGGLETFQDGSGALWAVFDTWNRPTRNGRFYCCRSLQLARVLSH
ncbi:MAG: glycoside hydrolase family 43 protein [Actinomycetota bacterium]|nr:glycoside hydrolase family 43 protein [Actinomycetota bacterium]